MALGADAETFKQELVNTDFASLLDPVYESPEVRSSCEKWGDEWGDLVCVRDEFVNLWRMASGMCAPFTRAHAPLFAW